MEEVFIHLWVRLRIKKNKKTLNEIKEDIQDSTWNQTEKKEKCEIEDRVANGIFPCKYCNQTFSKLIYAMSHEKKSCRKSKSNQTKNKLSKRFLIHLWTKKKLKIYLGTKLRQEMKTCKKFLIHLGTRLMIKKNRNH